MVRSHSRTLLMICNLSLAIKSLMSLSLTPGSFFILKRGEYKPFRSARCSPTLAQSSFEIQPGKRVSWLDSKSTNNSLWLSTALSEIAFLFSKKVAQICSWVVISSCFLSVEFWGVQESLFYTLSLSVHARSVSPKTIFSRTLMAFYTFYEVPFHLSCIHRSFLDDHGFLLIWLREDILMIPRGPPLVWLKRSVKHTLISCNYIFFSLCYTYGTFLTCSTICYLEGWELSKSLSSGSFCLTVSPQIYLSALAFFL